MKPLPHHYLVHLAGGPAGYAALNTEGVPELRSAPPLEFDGPGDAWAPEHLLLAAVEACFLFTLRAVAKASQLEFLRLDLSAHGTVDRQDGVTKFMEIILRPRLTIGAGVNLDRVERILHKSERACLVSASIATPIRVEPEIIVEPSLVS